MFRPADRIAELKPSTIRQLFDRGKDCINLGLGEPDFFTPQVIRDEAARVLTNEKLPYTFNYGLPKLRAEVLRHHYEDDNLDKLMLTAGSQEGLFSALLAFVNPGDEIMIPDPGFLAYPALACITGAESVRYRLAGNTFRFDAEAFKEAVSPRTRVVLLNSPSNPTGQVLLAEDMASIAAILRGRDIIVVSDEIYGQVYFDEKPPSYHEYDRNALIVSGFSKAYSMTGWRLGWVYGPAEALARINLIHAYVTTCASTLAQKAALAAFTPEGQQQREQLREQLRRRRDLMARELEQQVGLPFLLPVAGFYFLLDISRHGCSSDVAERCLQAGVITVPGSAFGEACEGYLRLSCSADDEKLIEGIRRIKAALSEKPDPVVKTKG